MSERPRRGTQAAGILIALGAVGGSVYGAINAQPSMGLLAGIGIGAVFAVLFWLLERR